jgi:hypothetical protein
VRENGSKQTMLFMSWVAAKLYTQILTRDVHVDHVVHSILRSYTVVGMETLHGLWAEFFLDGILTSSFEIAGLKVKLRKSGYNF